jgi:hypothetical protein
MNKKPEPSTISSSLTMMKMAINFGEISQATSNKLCHIAEWVDNRTTQEYESIKRRNDENTRGNEIRLLTNFPESKLF